MLRMRIRRNGAFTAREDPAALLTGIDRYMYDPTAAHHYATLFFGRYDDGSGRFDYVNCGHNPLLRRSHGAEWLAPTAPRSGCCRRGPAQSAASRWNLATR